MGYISFLFAVLLVASLIIYYIIPKKYQWVVLLLSSILFYASYELKYFAFLLFNILITFLSAIYIGKAADNHLKKRLLILYLITNFMIWYIVNCSGWTISMLNYAFSLFHMDIRITLPTIIVPLGISYYTLQSIAYLVDVYKGKIKPEKNVFKLATYISYFPAIVQGPISRFDDLSKRLFHDAHKFDYSNFCFALQLILYGMMKKIVIADNLAVFVNNIFQNYSSYGGFILYIGAVFFSIQLYMDFSGCVDICRGVSSLFGVKLMQNFNKPYYAMSIKDFWSRWHISLSSWLKDYIYIPLGGNRKGRGRKYLNLVITFLISGLWHGAGFAFLAWGLLHAVYQIFGEITVGIRKKAKRWLNIVENSASDKFYKVLITFHLVTFAWIPFRAPSLSSALQYIKNMVTNYNPWVLTDGFLFQFGISFTLLVFLVINIVSVFFVEYKQYRYEIQYRYCIAQLHICLRWGIYFLLIFDLLIFGAYGAGYSSSAFLYGGF